MSDHYDPIQRAERLAARRQGAINHRQATACGVTTSQLTTLTSRGRWVRCVVGVYRVAGAPETDRQRAMVAYLATCGSGGVISFHTAGAAWGMVRASSKPHVTVPRTASARSSAATVHRSDVAAIDRRHRDGMVVTAPSRTIVDLAGVVERPVLEAIVDDACCRKLVTARSIEAAIDRMPGGCAGKVAARTAVAVWTPHIEPGSPAEVRLVRLAAVEGIHGLVPQYEVFDESGAFVARLDLADPVGRRAFEYDGVAAHDPRRWDRDEARYARLDALGWRIEPITKLDLLPGERRLREIAEHWRRCSSSVAPGERALMAARST